MLDQKVFEVMVDLLWDNPPAGWVVSDIAGRRFMENSRIDKGFFAPTTWALAQAQYNRIALSNEGIPEHLPLLARLGCFKDGYSSEDTRRAAFHQVALHAMLQHPNKLIVFTEEELRGQLSLAEELGPPTDFYRLEGQLEFSEALAETPEHIKLESYAAIA